MTSHAPMLRRVLSGVGANGYAQATTIAMQLLSLPLFLSRWDLATYGQWLIISAIPSYIGLADVGMVTAAGNRMTMLCGRGDLAGANRVFQSTLAFMLAVCGAAVLVSALALAAAPAAWFGDGNAGALAGAVGGNLGGWFGAASGRLAVGALALGTVLALFGGLSEAVYRASERYATGTALANTVRLAEWFGSIAGLWLDGSFVAVAGGGLLMRAAGTLILIAHSARSAPQLRWRLADANRCEARETAVHAVWFMAFPAANALSLQGLTLVVAAQLGPAATAVFNTYRTLARVTVQATGSFSHALWPEFSRLKGSGDQPALAALYRRSLWIGWGIAALGSAVVYVLAPTVLDLWSKGRMPFDARLMAVAMVYAALSGAWHVPRILLLATNEHARLALQFLVVSALSVPVALWLSAWGADGVMAAMAVAETAMLVMCGAAASRSLGATGLYVQEARS